MAFFNTLSKKSCLIQEEACFQNQFYFLQSIEKPK